MQNLAVLQHTFPVITWQQLSIARLPLYVAEPQAQAHVGDIS